MRADERKVLDDLRQLRLDLDLTYEELAARLGVSRRNLVRLLTERRGGMHDRTQRRIERFLAANRQEVA